MLCLRLLSSSLTLCPAFGPHWFSRTKCVCVCVCVCACVDAEASWHNRTNIVQHNKTPALLTICSLQFTWFSGYALPQTVYTCIYVHQPSLLQHAALSAYLKVQCGRLYALDARVLAGMGHR